MTMSINMNSVRFSALSVGIQPATKRYIQFTANGQDYYVYKGPVHDRDYAEARRLDGRTENKTPLARGPKRRAKLESRSRAASEQISERQRKRRALSTQQLAAHLARIVTRETQGGVTLTANDIGRVDHVDTYGREFLEWNRPSRR